MRTLFAAVGLLLLLVCWVGPLPELAKGAFFAHMTLHMCVVAVAAPLLAFSIAGLSIDPVRKQPWLFAPIPVSVVELLVVWSWHAPELHHVARHSMGGLIAEQAMFLGCGVWLWLSAFGGELPRSGSRAAAGVIGMLLTAMHMTLLGALLIFAPRPLYSHANALAALSPLGDQQLGGAIMLILGGATYLAGGLWLTFDLLRATPTHAKSQIPYSRSPDAN